MPSSFTPPSIPRIAVAISGFVAAIWRISALVPSDAFSARKSSWLVWTFWIERSSSEKPANVGTSIAGRLPSSGVTRSNTDGSTDSSRCGVSATNWLFSTFTVTLCDEIPTSDGLIFAGPVGGCSNSRLTPTFIDRSSVNALT